MAATVDLPTPESPAKKMNVLTSRPQWPRTKEPCPLRGPGGGPPAWRGGLRTAWAGWPTGEQAVGVGQAPVPGCGADAGGSPEGLRVLGEGEQFHARGDHGGDDLAEGPLPRDGSPRAAEVGDAPPRGAAALRA